MGRKNTEMSTGHLGNAGNNSMEKNGFRDNIMRD